MTALTATIDLPDVSQPFELPGLNGLKVRPRRIRRPMPTVSLTAWNVSGAVVLEIPTDDARKLAAYIWAAAAEADARAKS